MGVILFPLGANFLKKNGLGRDGNKTAAGLVLHSEHVHRGRVARELATGARHF
jgi:hypothetical protein